MGKKLGSAGRLGMKAGQGAVKVSWDVSRSPFVHDTIIIVTIIVIITTFN
jgi:hypothetical protein